MLKKLILVSVALLAWKVQAQEAKKEAAKPAAEINWYLKDPKTDNVFGVGAEKAYQLLNGKTPKDVIVAVIDSGVETDHPDLKEVIWVNEDEIPNNGIDDDKNGYVDDVHGWSFLGGASDDIDKESLELARMCRNEGKYFDGKDINSLNSEDKTRHDKFLKLKEDLTKENAKNQQQYQSVAMLSNYIDNVKAASNGIFSKKTNKAYAPKDEVESRIKKRIGAIMLVYSPDKLDHELTSAKETFGNMIKMNSIDADSVRKAIVGDNPTDMSEKYYGCNRYEGPDAMHGTHVSGIIAAKRGNGIGIEGIASNAKIMVLRAVPNGDERDKDIANAIYYAVDNGAKVINMSFGKYYTPNKDVVDAAIKYAKSKDVLFVHAAGNDAKNKDIEDSYPTRILNDGTIADNWIEVGASSSKKKKKLLAEFSNYGSKTVDVFAPGVDIYSTVPNASYEDASGTSMACPATAGVAALIRGYFPELTAAQVKEVLMKTSIPYKKTISIPGKSGKEGKGKMNDVSISEGFVNAAAAVQYLLNK
jgi:subtilisin family serine protease